MYKQFKTKIVKIYLPLKLIPCLFNIVLVITPECGVGYIMSLVSSEDCRALVTDRWSKQNVLLKKKQQ